MAYTANLSKAATLEDEWQEKDSWYLLLLSFAKFSTATWKSCSSLGITSSNVREVSKHR